MRWPWLRKPSRWGTILLGVWLIAWGALQLLPRLAPQLHIPYAELLLGVIAVIAGVLLLLER
jgi:uncharacterized membrane protein HdeD (DUF308 family)